jgi:hypothetical protein
MSREESIKRMRAIHSMATRRTDPFPVTGPWSFRELCEHQHGWRDVGEHWMQCTLCWWCKPKLGKPPKLEKLPAILKNCSLPPLTGKIDLRAMYANAGFIFDDDRNSVLSIVRVRVVQYPWTTDPHIRRCGVEVKFKDYGWREAGVFLETWLNRLTNVLLKAEPRKPKALWSAIQIAMENNWVSPWERKQ